MTSKQRARVRKALEQLRTHLVQRGPARIEPSRTDVAAAGIADEDAQALAEMLQVLASSRNRDQAVLLGRIDRALRKLDMDPEDFSLCEECEEEIDSRRLAITVRQQVRGVPGQVGAEVRADPAQAHRSALIGAREGQLLSVDRRARWAGTGNVA